MDAVLGPPAESAGAAAARNPRTEGHAATRRARGPEPARPAAAGAARAPGARRADHAAGARTTSAGACPCRRPRRTASRRSTRCSRRRRGRPTVAHVCDDIACRLAGAEDVCADLERALGPGGGAGARRHGSAGCAARASGGASWRPAAMFTIAGEAPVETRRRRCRGIDAGAARSGAARAPAAPPRVMPRGCARVGAPGRRAQLCSCRAGRTSSTRLSLDDYLAHRGFVGLRRALAMGRRRSIDEVTARSSSAAAAPRSRPGASGPPSPRQPRAAALRRLQRRRVRARHVQGPAC